MPVTGLPPILERMMNSLVADSRLTSYKMAGFQEKVTLVLRFNNTTMADTDVGATGCSTSGTFRRKSPSQIQRDKTRKGNRKDSSTIPRNQESRVTEKDRKSLCHSHSHSTDDEAGVLEVDHIENEKDGEETSGSEDRMASTQVSKTIPLSTKNWDHKKDEKFLIDDTGFNSPNMYSVLSDIHDCQHSMFVNEPTPTQQQPDTTHQHTDYQTGTPHSDHSHCATKECTHNRHSDCHSTELFDLYVDNNENHLEWKRDELSEDNIKQVTRKDRNNRIKKLLLDYSGFTEQVLAETDDMLVEYCTNKKKVITFTYKTSNPRYLRDRMRLRQLEAWKDSTRFIEEKYPDAIPTIEKALPLLKQYIS